MLLALEPGVFLSMLLQFPPSRLFWHGFPLRDHLAMLSLIVVGRFVLMRFVLLPCSTLLEGVSAFRSCTPSPPLFLFHFVRSLPAGVSLWSGISPGLRSCSLKWKSAFIYILFGFSLRKRHGPQSLAASFSCPRVVLAAALANPVLWPL